MKRISIVLGAAALLMAMPVAQAGAGDATASGKPLAKIVGPDRLAPAKVLQFKIYCSVNCAVHVTVKLIIPGPNVVTTASATTSPGHPLTDKITLLKNTPADLKANYRVSRLKVILRARNTDTQAKRTFRRTFRFKHP